MTSKAQRRAKARKTRRPRDAAGESAHLKDLPRPVKLVVSGIDRVQAYLEEAHGDPELAANALFDEATKTAEHIGEIAAPYDAFDVLELVRLSQTLINPETYRETEHEGSAVVVELVAAVLSARGHRSGTAPTARGHRARADAAVQEILEQARVAVDAALTATTLRGMSATADARYISLSAQLRELSLRNLSYSHMLEETLSALFDDPAVEDACRHVTGCTVREIRAVFAAIEGLQAEGWERRFSAIGSLATLMRSELQRLGTAAAATESPSAEIIAESRQLWDAAWEDPADAATFPSEQISASSGVDRLGVERVLDLFSTDMNERATRVAAEEFFRGAAPFGYRPLLRDRSGAAIAIHGGLLLPAIRGRVEAALRTAGRWERYQKHRADYLERTALALLMVHFPTASVHQGFEYFIPSPEARVPETTPATFTKLVEGDGLLVVDDVAIIVEGKAGALTQPSRQGDLRRLTTDLRKIITDADKQAQRLSDRILADRGLRLRDDTWLDLRHVREIHSIAVSLEDLSGIATTTSELVRAGLLTHPSLPWTVSIHDLQIISELIDRPAELLLYLRRRTEPDVTLKYHAIDELDFFLEYLQSGLYVEPDPERVWAELPQFGEPTASARRRFREQPHVLLTSRTDSLDAWYFHRLGLRRAPAPKPRLNADATLCELVDDLAQRQEAGWLRIGATLLGFDAPLQRKTGRFPRTLAKLTKSDGRLHSVTIAGGTRVTDSYVLAWSTIEPRPPTPHLENRFAQYITAKKHQTQVAIGAGFLYDARRPGSPLFVAYDNRELGNDAELDVLLAKSPLRPIERVIERVPQPRDRARRGGHSKR